MTTINPSVSVCRHCQHYRLEGRRGGHCQQLGAPVQARWKSCRLAVPAFAPSWEASVESDLWEEEPICAEPGIISSYTLECLENCMHSEVSDVDELLLHQETQPAISGRLS
ncbi:MAG: hypothetical protein VKL39_01045 [Leptolyngbyaceae bacterium]|nr:hypothetical protein [Leptolyngbyaceae bacterium]